MCKYFGLLLDVCWHGLLPNEVYTAHCSAQHSSKQSVYVESRQEAVCSTSMQVRAIVSKPGRNWRLRFPKPAASQSRSHLGETAACGSWSAFLALTFQWEQWNCLAFLSSVPFPEETFDEEIRCKRNIAFPQKKKKTGLKILNLLFLVQPLTIVKDKNPNW